MFALMGNMYPWASPVQIGRLTVGQLGMYLDALPDVEMRRHSSNATIAWLIGNFGAKRTQGTPEDWLPGHARPAKRAEPSRYTEAEARSMRLAMKWRYMRQATMDKLDWREVQKAAPSQ